MTAVTNATAFNTNRSNIATDVIESIRRKVYAFYQQYAIAPSFRLGTNSTRHFSRSGWLPLSIANLDLPRTSELVFRTAGWPKLGKLNLSSAALARALHYLLSRTTRVRNAKAC